MGSLHPCTWMSSFFLLFGTAASVALFKLPFAGTIAWSPQACTRPFRRLPDLLREACTSPTPEHGPHPAHHNNSLRVATSRKLASPSMPGVFTPFSLSFGPFQAKANTSDSAVHAPQSAPHSVELLLSFGQERWQNTFLLHTPIFQSFRMHPWPPSAPFQHRSQWRLLWPGSSAILSSHVTCPFSWVKVAFSSRRVCNWQLSTPASAQSPGLRQTCVHKSACLWLAPMQSSSSSFKACTTPRWWVGKSGGPLRLHKAMYKAQMSAFSTVLHTSNKNSDMILPIPYHWVTPSSGSIGATAHPQAANPSTIPLKDPSTASLPLKLPDVV